MVDSKTGGEGADLIGGAILVVVIGLLEVMTVAGAAERKHGKATDLNGELIGQVQPVGCWCDPRFPGEWQPIAQWFEPAGWCVDRPVSVISGLVVFSPCCG